MDTLTAGQMIKILSELPPDTPVTVALPNRSWWFNIEEITDPRVTDEPSAIIMTRDDFDTRQF